MACSCTWYSAVLHGTPPLGNSSLLLRYIYYTEGFAFHVYIKGVGNDTGGYLEHDVENCVMCEV